jgi:hypothetical protein
MSPPPAPEPGFDWESLLGIKGAAVVGGIAFVIAAVLFAKLAFERGWIGPELRIAILLLSGIAMLVGAEWSLRRGYATTANSVSGAGIAVLYIGLYAGRALYHLFSLPLTFALMSLVTIVAGLLAVRYNAFVTAVLGLMGGFLTPVLLSTGEDRPIGLFSYVLLLNLGLLSIAVARRWHGLALLALGGTFLIEMGWFSRFMAPEKMIIGLVAFLLFGLLYLGLLFVGRDEEGETSGLLGLSSGLGGLVPFLFALLLAGNRQYADEWPLLFGFLALLGAALAAVAILRQQTILALGGASASGLLIALFALQSLTADALWGPVLSMIGLTLLWNAVPRVAGHIAEDNEDRRPGQELAALLAAGGLGGATVVMVARGFGEPAGPFLMLLLALVGILFERTRPGGLPGVAALGPIAAACVAEYWFFVATRTETLPAHLAVPLLLVALFSIGASVRHAVGRDATSEEEAGVVGAALVALFGLGCCLVLPAFGGDPVPLFSALAVLAALLVVSSVRSENGSPLLGVALLASAGYVTVWQAAYFETADGPVVFAFAALLYLAFLALPFSVPAGLLDRWRGHRTPWFVAALAGPLFFFVLRQTLLAMGGGAVIGVLPIAMAALSVAALAGIRNRFGIGQPQLRLRYLALFAAVALGFVAIAIPLQLDRQWITIGWALEGAAVFWLYGRLPHGGLRVFGTILFTLVGIRLLGNPWVLQYHERGTPIVNWLLYTYGVPALACLAGARLLRQAEAAHRRETSLPAGVSFLGLLLIFALINLEIFDYFGTSRYVEMTFERRNERDLTMSAAWGLYAIGLLVVGVWRDVRALRFVSLGFLLLTVAKVFLYDLSNLAGLARILSFLGLAISLILVSLFYQRFVFRKEETS